MRFNALFILLLLNLAANAFQKNDATQQVVKYNKKGQEVYQDKPYTQEYSIRYVLTDEQKTSTLQTLSVNRDNQIRIVSSHGLLVPDQGSLFYPGKFITDNSYPQLLTKEIISICTYQDQTFYLDNKQVFSNAWAGKIQVDHPLPNAKFFAVGKDFHCLISDGSNLIYLDQYGKTIFSGKFNNLIQVRYHEATNSFLLVSPSSVAEFIPSQSIIERYAGSDITCALRYGKQNNLIIGTSKGNIIYSNNSLVSKLPCPQIQAIEEIDQQLWFGSANGAFRLHADGKYSYYAGQRWLPDNDVVAITKGKENDILILTRKGIAKICLKQMNLEDKAMFYEKQVREKNMRYGINCSGVKLIDNYSSAQVNNQPSDNLWTGMYLVSQLYRYKVTGSTDAKQNAFESFEALERLHTVTGIKGLFARSFERDYKVENNKDSGWQERELITGSPAALWLSASDHHNWTWRSTASSDQTVGQVFALTAILELVDDTALKARALRCLDDLIGYIVDNNLYIIDVDGEPTMWGKWNPDYVNSFPKNIGDRKITSSNIIAFLQTAYRFTKKEKYKIKAIELMEEFGYLENLMRPMKEIGSSDNDKLSKVLSEEWNHSDDEMYFLAYWGLYPYAFNTKLKDDFREAIKDHWEIERPEGDALWNFTYAMTGAKEFDLKRSIDFLKEYPIDLRNWGMHNSTRQDIELIPKNFRGQTTKERLPLGELPIFRHNGQIFTLDSEGDGKVLFSAGDTWLLPYWMGRYLGVISGPSKMLN